MDFLKPYADLIERNIQSLNLPATPETLYQPQRYILASNGKRIRPVLTLLGCGLCGGDIRNAMPAATAVELVHNFTLIHDDIMDQAESRRGKPSVHMKWNLSTAILSGDGMYTQALLLLQNLPGEVDFKEINRVFLEGINRVCEGQALDMEFEQRLDVTPEEYLDMISGKTAALLSVSMRLGALCAGAPAEQVALAGELGHSLGIGFQVQDDLLDVIADPEKFGKTPGGDISEAKKTFLMVKTLQYCNKPERDWLVGCLKNRPLQPDDVQKVMELYKMYGVTEEARSLIGSYYQKAEKIAEQFGESDYKQDLYNLINYLKNREF